MQNSAIGKAYVQLHLAVLLFGGAGLFAKLVPIGAGLLVWGRTVWALLFLFVLMRLTKEKIGDVGQKEIK